MNVVDVALGIGLLVFAWTGWRRGFIYGLASLVGFGLGAVAGLWLAPRFVDRWEPGLGATLVALTIVFLCAAAGQVLVGLFGKRLRESVTWEPAVKLDAIGGSVLAVVSLLVVAWFVADVYVSGNRSSMARDVRQSQVLGFVDELMPEQAEALTDDMKELWNSSGFPDVLAGFGGESVRSVGQPDARILRRPAVQQSMAETVMVLGAASCDRQIEGSGFAFAPERVITNAHVVAGVDEPQLFVGGDGGGVSATVVYFDPDRDLAVLAAPGLAADALPLEPDVVAGDAVAVTGYPGGGDLTGTAARVRSVQRITGQDIYGRGVVIREVLSLRAKVQPGNSGGPVLDERGEVVGVVFATSLDHRETAYALTVPELAEAISVGMAATDPVDTGPCT